VIGEQVARLRRARDLTQEQLAAQAGVSVDVIRRLEQGQRHTARINTLTKLANALGAELSVILAPRATFSPEPDRGIPGIRDAVTGEALDSLTDLAESDSNAVDLGPITASVDAAWHIWQRGDYSVLSRLLPNLIIETRHASRQATGNDQRNAFSLLTTAYELAAGITVMLGYEDLAWLCAERAVTAAEQSGDSVDHASAVYWAAWILRRQGRCRESHTVAMRAAERHEPSLIHATEAELTVWGGLLVNAAGAAARDGRHEASDELLTVARGAAARLTADRVDRWSVFGPRIVAQSAVVNATEAGDFESAARRAANVDRVGGRVPPTWEARYLLALAQAQVELGHDAAAITTLDQARGTAPEWIRYHRLARDLTADLTSRIPTGRRQDLDLLARHLHAPTQH
jgi:transcriptional regulator with XRE-family HTH domain